MAKRLAYLLTLTLVVQGTCAAPGPDQQHIERIKKKVARGLEQSQHVSVETYDGRKLQGMIREADPDSFVLSFQGASVSVGYADVKTVKWRSAMSKTATTVLIVAAVGGTLLLGVVLLGGLKN